MASDDQREALRAAPPAPEPAEVGGDEEAQIARILEALIEQIEAELREAGFTTERIEADVRAAFDRAKAQIERSATGTGEGGEP